SGGHASFPRRPPNGGPASDPRDPLLLRRRLTRTAPGDFQRRALCGVFVVLDCPFEYLHLQPTTITAHRARILQALHKRSRSPQPRRERIARKTLRDYELADVVSKSDLAECLVTRRGYRNVGRDDRVIVDSRSHLLLQGHSGPPANDWL